MAGGLTGRFAPSPTGGLHLGSALAALAAWASVRSRDGRMVYRVEDLDGPRVMHGAAEAQMATLRRLGLDWDEGPDVGGPNGPYLQSERGHVYSEAQARLAARGRLFPCRVSRRELAGVASAPHGSEGPAYPRSLRPAGLAPDWLSGAELLDGAAIRFLVDDPPVTFHDAVMGEVTEDVGASVGDFVLRRRDGVFAYQLAVVVDDIAMGVTEVVRGADLLGSTARQILLHRALDAEPPAYGHVPLVVNEAGEKLSKRDGAAHVDSLFAAGVEAEEIVGWLAWALGQQGRPAATTAAAVAAHWDWGRVGRRPVAAPSSWSQASM